MVKRALMLVGKPFHANVTSGKAPGDGASVIYTEVFAVSHGRALNSR